MAPNMLVESISDIFGVAASLSASNQVTEKNQRYGQTLLNRAGLLTK
jgi:hypothetical protein